MEKIIKSLTLVGILLGGYLWQHNNVYADSGTQTDEAKWEKKAPRLFNNVGYADLDESAQTSKNMPESWIELRGTITNPFGIRDDILEYILANVPESNVRDTRVLIKMVQYDQEIYYSNPTESEALVLDAKEGLAMRCFSSGMDKFNKLDEIEKLTHNTKERDQHMWAIDRKYFSWKVLGTGLSDADEKIACAKGLF